MERNKKQPDLKASDFQTIENFAKKKKRFVIEKLSKLSVSYTIANKYLAEAIAHSTSLRTVNFENLGYASKPWIMCDGILNNNSIDSLGFNGFLSMDARALEIIGQTFTIKKIRRIHFALPQISKTEVLEKFTTCIANCGTLECISMSCIASYSSTDYYFACLRNKAVKKLVIRQSSIIIDQFRLLARYINNSNITHLHLGLRMPLVDLTPIIAASNCVQNLTLNNNIKTVEEVRILINALKNNTKIESLKFICDKYPPEDPIDFAQQLDSLITQTKTLKGISFVDRSATRFALNGIASNRSLTALDVTVMTEELYDFLCEAILNHPRIEKVKIRSVQPPDHLISLNLINSSKTLTDIDISDSENLDDGILKQICESMTRRQVLRRIRMTLDTTSLADNHDLFWKALTDCTSLNCFEIDYSCSKPFSSAIWSRIESVLEKNKGITSIGKFSDIPDNIKRLLDNNRKIVQDCVSYTKMLVSMMARRSDPFTEKLPLEIWVMILKRIRYHGVNINFEELLLNLMNKS